MTIDQILGQLWERYGWVAVVLYFAYRFIEQKLYPDWQKRREAQFTRTIEQEKEERTAHDRLVTQYAELAKQVTRTVDEDKEERASQRLLLAQYAKLVEANHAIFTEIKVALSNFNSVILQVSTTTSDNIRMLSVNLAPKIDEVCEGVDEIKVDLARMYALQHVDQPSKNKRRGNRHSVSTITVDTASSAPSSDHTTPPNGKT